MLSKNSKKISLSILLSSVLFTGCFSTTGDSVSNTFSSLGGTINSLFEPIADTLDSVTKNPHELAGAVEEKSKFTYDNRTKVEKFEHHWEITVFVPQNYYEDQIEEFEEAKRMIFSVLNEDLIDKINDIESKISFTETETNKQTKEEFFIYLKENVKAVTLQSLNYNNTQMERKEKGIEVFINVDTRNLNNNFHTFIKEELERR